MKLATKWIAGCCALVLLFSLAACKGETEAEPSDSVNEAYVSEHTNAGQPLDEPDSLTEAQTGEPASSEDAPAPSGESTEKAGSQPSISTAAPNKALSKTEVLALYQAGVNQTKNLKRVKYSRKLTYGKLWSPGNFDGAEFDLVEDKEKAAPIFNSTDTAPKAAGLPALQESMVDTATCKETGGKRVLTIRLKAKSGDQGIKDGAGGYLDLVSFEQVGDMANAYGKAIFRLANIKTNAIQTTLSAGAYTVTLAANGKIEKAALTYQQTVKGDMKLSLPSYEIQCDVRFQMTMDYAS